MTILLPKPRLTVDIGPLMELQWTGIPVFTRRAVQSLIRQPNLTLDYAFEMVKLPDNLVNAAIAANSGGILRDSYERYAGEFYGTVDLSQPIYFPTVKQHLGVIAHESSTVHDMSTLLMPENHELANVDFHMEHLVKELETDEVVFCVSEATEAALTTAFPSVKSKTKVLYQYADWPQDFEHIDCNLPMPQLGRYAAVIGTLEPRKNLSIIIDSLSIPSIRDSDVKFVVIGKKGWKVDAFLAQLNEQQRRRIVFSGFVTEFVKYRLLRHSEFLVFPSVYEGFGIPALEAMLLGKPVLASMTSSFPEVVGPAGIYFDPHSPESFAEAFDKLADVRVQAALAPLAVSQASTFNQTRMSSSIMEWLRQG